jgi:hypothetical protein
MAFYKITFAVEEHALPPLLKTLGTMGRDISPSYVIEREEELPVNDTQASIVQRILATPKTGKGARGRPKHKRPDGKTSTDIMVERLRESPATYAELKDAIQAAGFQMSSIGSAMMRLKRIAPIKKVGRGRWALVSKSHEREDA